MSIRLIDISFYDEFTGTGGGGAAYLLGSVGDRISMVLNVEAFWAAEDIHAIFLAVDKTITRNDIGGSFLRDGFHAGEEIAITGTASNDGAYLIVEVTDTVITVAESLTDETATGAFIYGNEQVTAMDYYWNLVENASAESYFSLTDTGTVQRLNATGLDASDTTPVDLKAKTNSRAWLIYDTATVEGVSWIGYRQKFKIKMDFLIGPNYRAGQLRNL